MLLSKEGRTLAGLDVRGMVRTADQMSERLQHKQPTVDWIPRPVVWSTGWSDCCTAKRIDRAQGTNPKTIGNRDSTVIRVELGGGIHHKSVSTSQVRYPRDIVVVARVRSLSKSHQIDQSCANNTKVQQGARKGTRLGTKITLSP